MSSIVLLSTFLEVTTMGILDSIESMAGGQSGDTNTRVAGGLMQTVEQHPGGLGAVLQSFQNNGLGGHVQAAQNGQTPQMTPDHVQTGLQGTGILESVAQRAGVSPEVAKVALATILPMVMAHYAQNGSAPSGSVLGGMLSRML
jgi:uncharacterized protein YidB (DUF937 family)